MKLPKLYKKTKTGAIEEWEIEWGDGYYSITHGQVDGAKQTKENKVKGKNIGKANETSNLQQAENEALSRWKKQIDKGYSQNKNKLNFVIPKPMLAHKFEDHCDKITYPCHIQPKLDGVRCVAYLKDDDVVLLSRQGKKYNIPHIQLLLFPFLKANPDIVLDGELYIHGTPFQTLISWIKKEQSETTNVEYHIYDMIDNKPFSVRTEFIASLFDNLIPDDKLKFVTTEECSSKQEIYIFHDQFIVDRYEGSIIRYGQRGYEAGYRSQYLLKLKDFITDEFEIIGAEQDKNKPKECTFVLVTKDGGLFKCKSEGSQEYREQQWLDYQNDPDSFHGKMMTVRYFEMTTSDEPVPRFPVGVTIDRWEYE